MENEEWKMINDLLKAYQKGHIELYDDHLLFLCNPCPDEGKIPGLINLYDENLPAEDQLQEWQIKTLYWLYDWKMNDVYVPFDEYEIEK